MKKSYRNIFGLIVLALFLSGCVTNPPVKSSWSGDTMIENEYFSATILPTNKRFKLTVKNKTKSDLVINWNKTLFIESGQTAGGFMIEGTLYTERNNPKLSDVVFPESVFEKTIWPNSLVSYEGGKYGRGYIHGLIVGQDVGVYLTVSVDGVEISERIVGSMSYEYVK